MTPLTFNGITIPYGHIITGGPYPFTGIRSVREDAVDGTPQIWEGEQSGWAFILSGNDRLKIEKSIVDQIYALSQAKYAVYELDYYGSGMLVRFNHEDPPVVGGTPVWDRPEPVGTDYYHSFFMKLMKVGKI